MVESEIVSNSFTKTQIQKYRMLFNMIDVDGDAKISCNDLKSAFKDIGVDFNDLQIKGMLKNNKDIGFNEFLNIVKMRFGKFSEEGELKDAFAMFIDQNDNGDSNKMTIDGSLLKENLNGLANGDDEKKAVETVMAEFTKENKITGYKKFDADTFIDSIKQ